LGTDEATKQTVVVDMFMGNIHGGHRLPEILEHIADANSQVSADKAYDSCARYEAILRSRRQARPIILPKRSARLSLPENRERSSRLGNLCVASD
jgi:hypothetical protein